MLGGGIRLLNASPTITNCTLLRNNAGKFGGGLYTTDGSPIITNCAFIENTAEDGGGIYAESGSPTISNCTFAGNTASGDSYSYGGGIHIINGSPTITNCTFSGNKALGQESRGGAIYNRSNALISNCVFYGNHSDMLGGMFCNEADTPALINCTSSGNSAKSCGGIFIVDGSLTITNCILWGDTDHYSNHEIAIWYGPPPSVSYCDISQDGYAGSNGNMQLNPLFSDPANGNLRLTRGSPCIDAADSFNAPATDREWNERFDDTLTPDQGTGPFTFYDMGAYEFQGDIDGDGIRDDGDGSGLIGDHPCRGGEVAVCDDNCLTTPNGSGLGTCVRMYTDVHFKYTGSDCNNEEDCGETELCDTFQWDTNANGTGNACEIDADEDAVTNGDDNCPDIPNGPALGTCVKTVGGRVTNYRTGEPKHYLTCTTDLECTLTGGTCQLEQGDCNENGVGDAGECYANFNYPSDLKVNASDLGLYKQEYGRIDCKTTPPACEADANNDGKVNASDLGLLKNEYGRIDCPAVP